MTAFLSCQILAPLAEGTKKMTPSVVRLIDEVIPLTFLRELHVAEGGVDAKAEREELREAVAPLLATPGKCLVQVGRRR